MHCIPVCYLSTGTMLPMHSVLAGVSPLMPGPTDPTSRAGEGLGRLIFRSYFSPANTLTVMFTTGQFFQSPKLQTVDRRGRVVGWGAEVRVGLGALGWWIHLKALPVDGCQEAGASGGCIRPTSKPFSLTLLPPSLILCPNIILALSPWEYTLY